VTDVFYGYNRNEKIGDGEFSDMQNLTSSYYPLLANRGKRGMVANLHDPKAMLSKTKLAYIDADRLYYDGEDITSYLIAAGCSISAETGPKQLISMGAYIVLFPDKLFINTENFRDCGSLEMHFSTANNAAVSYTMCKADGSAYDAATISDTAPENPENGAAWIDTSGSVHSLKIYNSSTSMWTQIPTVYTKIACTGIGKNFVKYDGVKISGCTTSDTAVKEQVEALNGSKIIQDRGDDYIVVIGLVDKACTQNTGSVTIARTVPDLDFVTESENRLWGCKYGLVDGEMVNEIYCCALGNFKSWDQFAGISTDSWRASVGTDGEWTGAVTHLGYPIFFKENCLHKVYISSSGAHQIADTACRGVQKGSERSLVVVNETLFYKSVTDICAYDGSLPVSVSEALGPDRYFDAAAGAMGEKYYVSMRDNANKRHFFVFDTKRGFWHREDDTHAVAFARGGDELYYMDADKNLLMCVGGTDGVLEESAPWSATTGLIGYNTVEQKYVSRLNLRMKLPAGSFADVYVEYDSDGLWLPAGHIEGTGTKTFMLPLRPRRCDHFRFKIEGEGDVRIFSFAKILEVGSDM
jgi:hypothetical protein